MIWNSTQYTLSNSSVCLLLTLLIFPHIMPKEFSVPVLTQNHCSSHHNVRCTVGLTVRVTGADLGRQTVGHNSNSSVTVPLNLPDYGYSYPHTHRCARVFLREYTEQKFWSRSVFFASETSLTLLLKLNAATNVLSHNSLLAQFRWIFC
jgi:hypothetical protein